MKVKKAIIPAAGLGTRFLPATKSLPKEMLPIVDIPTIQYIVTEAYNSGIEEILIITNGAKQAIENHFDYNFELESRLIESAKYKDVEKIRNIAQLCDIYYIRQKEPKGLGHAVSCAKSFIGNEPFAILLGDDVVYNEEFPCLKQLINAFNVKQASILGVQPVCKDDVCKYGIVKPVNSIENDPSITKISEIVEKPNKQQAPSNLAVLGRYVLTSEIFEILDKQEVGKNNEIQLTDAIDKLMEIQDVYAYVFEGIRYDVGDKFGYIKANIDFALRNDEIKEQVLDYIKLLSKEK